MVLHTYTNVLVCISITKSWWLQMDQGTNIFRVLSQWHDHLKPHVKTFEKKKPKLIEQENKIQSKEVINGRIWKPLMYILYYSEILNSIFHIFRFDHIITYLVVIFIDDRVAFHLNISNKKKEIELLSI